MMTKGNNALNLADKYDLSDLEPDVDRNKAAAFLAGDNTAKLPNPAPRNVELPKTTVKRRSGSLRESVQLAKPEVWTSRTIRLRQGTARALTKAVCAQKTKQADGKLRPGELLTVQEIADRGIQLALAELGYDK